MTCSHKEIKDFSFKRNFDDKVNHKYCAICKCHWLDGIYISQKEWDEKYREKTILKNKEQ